MIALYKPYMPELPELPSIINSGSLAYGTYARSFEEELKAYLFAPHVLAVNSFFSALYIAMMVFGISAGDEVIASPMACLSSTQPLVARGLSVVWADVDASLGTLCPESVRKTITRRTKAILHNHFCGYPGHIDEINAIGREYGIPVIDDAIEAFGSLYKGKKLGDTGSDATVFSFNPVRFVNTIDGGAIVFNNKSHYEKAVLMRDCGIDRTRFRDNRQEINPGCDIAVPGIAGTMSEVNGYIGICQMKAIVGILDAHRLQARKWDAYFKNSDAAVPIRREGCRPNYWVYGILTENKLALLDDFRSLGYQASGVHINNSNYSVFGNSGISLPNAEKFDNTFLALPCGWWMDNKS